MTESIYNTMTDEELILRLRAGEQEILDYLLNKYKDLVRRKIRYLYLTGGAADDLIQEGMIGLFKAVRDYIPGKGAGFSTFAGICIDRQLYTAIESSNRLKNLPLNTSISLDDRDAEEIEADMDPETILIREENVRDMEETLRKLLSPLENRVLDLYLAGDTYREIAQKLNKTSKSVENALLRIRKKIRGAWQIG